MIQRSRHTSKSRSANLSQNTKSAKSGRSKSRTRRRSHSGYSKSRRNNDGSSITPKKKAGKSLSVQSRTERPNSSAITPKIFTHNKITESRNESHRQNSQAAYGSTKNLTISSGRLIKRNTNNTTTDDLPVTNSNNNNRPSSSQRDAYNSNHYQRQTVASRSRSRSKSTKAKSNKGRRSTSR